MIYKPLFTLILSVLIVPTSMSADVTKWVDENGRVHYGERPPEGVNSSKMKGQISSISSLENTPKTPVLYSTAWCGYCRKARAFMRANGVNFDEYDIEKDPIAKTKYLQKGGRGVPFLVKGDQKLYGYSEVRYKQFLGLESP